jgi:hypothetical protein
MNVLEQTRRKTTAKNFMVKWARIQMDRFAKTERESRQNRPGKTSPVEKSEDAEQGSAARVTAFQDPFLKF